MAACIGKHVKVDDVSNVAAKVDHPSGPSRCTLPYFLKQYPILKVDLGQWAVWMLRFDIIRDFAQISALILGTMTFSIPDVNFESFSKFYSIFSFDVPFLFPSVPPVLYFIGLSLVMVSFII